MGIRNVLNSIRNAFPIVTNVRLTVMLLCEALGGPCAAIKNFLSKNKFDVVRFIVLGGLSVLLFYPDLENFHTVKYVFAFLVVVAFITHVTRRLLFPYVDLNQFAKKALETSDGAAKVFQSVSIIIAVSIFVAASFFK